MENTLKTFPKECSTDPCNQWLIAFEKEAREILGNLERENHRLNIERNDEIDRGHRESARAYAEVMCHNSGRIFSLKQILGDLPRLKGKLASNDNNDIKGEGK